MEMSMADLVWNRAALESGGSNPGPGDRALADLLLAHGLVMNGGVLHAIEALTEEELKAAAAGYRYFGLHEVAQMLSETAWPPQDVELEVAENLEEETDRRYWQLVPSDSLLAETFESHYSENPGAFAPVGIGPWPGGD
jgi:hypothetical protein